MAMKKQVLSSIWLLTTVVASAQKYPDPEFGNEVYFLKKDSVYTLVRLEKNTSKMETKTKLGGLGGGESGYNIDGDKSPVRFSGGSHLSFVFSNNSASRSSSGSSDSAMRSNGLDPSMFSGIMGNMNDPSTAITLYKLDEGKGSRKIILQKSGGALPFSNHKPRSSDKYTFSAKKIRDGYWELIVDKTLPSGEYSFSMMDMSAGGMGGMLLFSFAID
jgi:uncharacterized protein YxeA